MVKKSTNNSNYPLVAIVILNWNKKDFVITLINQLQDSIYKEFDIIVVDNASTDNSVNAIKENFPNVFLLTNDENLGGTGGFNKGLDYAIKQDKYDYVWLLDNDAEVANNTLSELISVIESNDQIGIVGSRINDTNDRNLTVEAGSMIRKDTMGVKPLYRNTKDLKVDSDFIEVDYVAICSALIRLEALRKVGLMDERYFIFWDDMNWGLEFKRNGYKVACAIKSVVYHSTFTEKRSYIMDYYYSPRNSLLTYSKHTGKLERITLFYNFLRNYMKFFTFHLLSDDKQIGKLGFRSIYDFIADNWGGRNFPSPEKKVSEYEKLPANINKILLISSSTGGIEDLNTAFNVISKDYPESEISVLIKDDRKNLLNVESNHIIIDSSKDHKFYYLIFIFSKLVLKKFDCAITFRIDSHFSFAALNAYRYNPAEKKFSKDQNNLKNAWKIFASVIIGEILSFLTLPFVIFSSFKFYKQN